MVTSVRDPEIDRAFPGAFDDGYDLTSDANHRYNCIAWAADVDTIRWWPTPSPKAGWYWPPGIPRSPTIPSFVQAFATLGYQDCGDDGTLEGGYEKVAIYVDPTGTVTHMAWQLADGLWTSKLGQYKDIVHSTPKVTESTAAFTTAYGTIALYMKRPRRSRKCQIPRYPT